MSTVDIKDIKKQARQSLKDNLRYVITALLLMVVINIILAGVPVLGWIAALILNPVLAYGMGKVFLLTSRGQGAGIETLFSGLDIMGKVIASNVIVGLIGLLGSIITTLVVLIISLGVSRWYFRLAMVILALNIVGMVISLGFSMVGYIIVDDEEEITPFQAVGRSWEIMKGYKWELLKMQLTFIGWILLGTFTCGIAFIWIVPYMGVANAGFYDYISNEKGPVKRKDKDTKHGKSNLEEDWDEEIESSHDKKGSRRSMKGNTDKNREAFDEWYKNR